MKRVRVPPYIRREHALRGFVLAKKSGPVWGLLVHGNRILAAAVFYKIASTDLQKPISAFQVGISTLDIPALCTTVLANAEKAIADHYAGRFLAVLFKNPTESKHVFELSRT